MDFKYTEMQQMIKNMVREFAEREIKPVSDKVDHEPRFPLESIQKLAGMGILGLLVPQEFGGGGVDTISYSIVVEEVSRACASTAMVLLTHNAYGALPIAKYGSDSQKSMYLPAMAQGQKLGAFAITEADAGSDLGMISTVAKMKSDGSGYILNGTKLYVTNASNAEVFIIAATVDRSKGVKGLTCFLVERGMDGLTIGPNEYLLGLRGCGMAPVYLRNCEVSVDKRLGDEGAGFAIIKEAMAVGCIGVGAQAVGISEATLASAIEHATTRVQFGQTISKFQAVQWMIANMAVDIESARLMIYKAADLRDKNENIEIPAAMAKIQAADAAFRVTDSSIQVHGGNGYMRDNPIERYYRDARATMIASGTSEIYREKVALNLLG